VLDLTSLVLRGGGMGWYWIWEGLGWCLVGVV
jgi:hypothetical protein